MTTITGVLETAGGDELPDWEVRAVLKAASNMLQGGAGVVEIVTATTDEFGNWSLDLVPLSQLVQPGGAYYAIETRNPPSPKWNRLATINVPDSGTYVINSVLIVPGPMPPPAAVVKVWNPSLSNYVLAQSAVIYIGGPTDPTQGDGDFWLNVS